MKKCPFCAEEIQEEAIKCRYCGSMLGGSPDRFGVGASSSDGVRLEAARLLNSGGKIEAIKYVREKKGLGLAQAKAYVEALAAGTNPDDAARALPANPGGCAAILAFLVIGLATLIWWLSQ